MNPHRVSAMLLLVPLLLIGCYQGDGSEGPVIGGLSEKYINLSPGDKPALQLQATDGTAITSDTLRGKVTVLDFWASWCGPCMQQAPHMVKLHEQYAGKGVGFVGISMDTDKAAMDRAVQSEKLAWPQVLAEGGMEGELAKRFGLQAIPQVVILSSEGVVLWVGHPAELDKPLAKAAGG